MPEYEIYCSLLDEPLLVIPVEQPPFYSTKPLKWIRFATFTVLGIEGDLLKYAEDDACEDDLTLDMEDEAPSVRKLIYRPSTLAPVRFIDKDALYSTVSYRTQDTESQESFKNKVIERDKVGVGLEHPPPLAEPWHIIPYSKGSEYIQAVCKWRIGTEDPEIEDIDDIRNGILVDSDSRAFLCTGAFGVLRSPNFALSTDEVLPVSTKPHQDPRLRFTVHTCFDDLGDDNPVFAQHYRKFYDTLKQDLRYPTTADSDGWPIDWPPAFIWDFKYGVSMAKRFGNQDAMNIINNKVRSRYCYYNFCPESDECERINLRAQARAEIQSRREERNRRKETGGSQEGEKFSDAMDYVLRLSMLFGSRDESESQESKQHDQAVEKVHAWRTGVEAGEN